MRCTPFARRSSQRASSRNLCVEPTFTEAILESARESLQVAHAASTRGLTADRLDAPVVCYEEITRKNQSSVITHIIVVVASAHDARNRNAKLRTRRGRSRRGAHRMKTYIYAYARTDTRKPHTWTFGCDKTASRICVVVCDAPIRQSRVHRRPRRRSRHTRKALLGSPRARIHVAARARPRPPSIGDRERDTQNTKRTVYTTCGICCGANRTNQYPFLSYPWCVVQRDRGDGRARVSWAVWSGRSISRMCHAYTHTHIDPIGGKVQVTRARWVSPHKKKP